MKSCDETCQALENYLETSQRPDDSIQEHIAACKSCREHFFNTTMILKTAQTLPLEEAPGSMYEQIMQSLASTQPVKSSGNLALLLASFAAFLLVSNFDLEEPLWNTLSWSLAFLALLLLKPIFAGSATAPS